MLRTFWRVGLGAAVFCAVLAATLYLQEERPVESHRGDPASLWLEAVQDGDGVQAVAIAESLPLEPFPPLPNTRVVAFSERYGVDRALYIGPFTRVDWMGWRHSWEMKALSAALAGGAEDPVPLLFQAVCRELKKGDPAGAPPAWPVEVWMRRAGACDRLSWLLCALAEQAGCEGVLLLLRLPETGTSPHTICELITPQGRTYLADPYMEVLLPDTAFEDLAADPDRLTAIWPDRPDYRQAFPHSQRVMPFFPQDFAPRNQALSRFLSRRLGGDAPRFGRDPLQRCKVYEERLKECCGEGAREIHVWQYPFSVLHSWMRRFPK